MPKEHTKVTFVLAGMSDSYSYQKPSSDIPNKSFLSKGIRAPRTARNASEKPEPFGAESLKFASKYLQRDVEIGQCILQQKHSFARWSLTHISHSVRLY